jgi:hypothetical protein
LLRATKVDAGGVAGPNEPCFGLAERLQPGAVGGRETLLDAVEALIHALPSGGDQVDQHGQIVEPGVPFRLHLPGEALEPPDREAGESTHLGQLTCDGRGLVPDPVADGSADLLRQRRFELARHRHEVLDPAPRPLERGLDLSVALGPLLDRLEPHLRPLDGGLRHGPNASVAVG